MRTVFLFCVIHSIFELHQVMKSPESLVAEHALQGVREVRLLFAFCTL